MGQREYRVLGVEHVYDAFDEYEHANALPVVSLTAGSVADALDKATSILQATINAQRQSFSASGTFAAEVVRVEDVDGYCIFQDSRGLRRYFGGQLEDGSVAYADQRDVPFVSCFLSYNHRDEAFTRTLYDDLSRLGLNCWFAPVDLRSDHLERALEQAIENTDKLIVVLSKESLQSTWVGFEVDKALAKERESGERLLFPILLDSSALTSDVGWARDVQERDYGVDFSAWRDGSAYGLALDELVAGFGVHF